MPLEQMISYEPCFQVPPSLTHTHTHTRASQSQGMHILMQNCRYTCTLR